MKQESRKAGKGLPSRAVTERIGAAISVDRALGPEFWEPLYEGALAVEFALGGISFVRQKPIPLFNKDHQIGEHRLDFLVEGLAIGRSDLKATGLRDGLLLNFATFPPNDQAFLSRATFEVDHR
jgi:PD-(D/E)XK nuclease superfamily